MRTLDPKNFANPPFVKGITKRDVEGQNWLLFGELAVDDWLDMPQELRDAYWVLMLTWRDTREGRR